MRITFTRTGGLAGLVRPPVTLDTTRLSRAECGRWEARVRAAGFFELPAVIRPASPQPDRFHYTLTIEHEDGRAHTVAASEEVLPRPLGALIEALQEFARSANPEAPRSADAPC
jgi:Emfourin